MVRSAHILIACAAALLGMGVIMVHSAGSRVGGPDGAVILLSMKEVGGRVYDLLDDAGQVIRTISLADFQRGLEKQAARAAA